MASPEQSAVFTLPAYAGEPFAVPPELNPSGYDIVRLRMEFQAGEGGAANTSVVRAAIGCVGWDVIDGGGGPFATGMVSNGAGSPLPAGNRGTARPGGDFSTTLLGAPLDAIVWATLGRLTGTDQGER